MDPESVDCPSCGWRFDQAALTRRACRKCSTSLVVTSLSYLESYEQPAVKKLIAFHTTNLKEHSEDQESLLALAICYLRLGLFDPADGYLKRMVESHPAEAGGYYYRAIAALRGKRPRLASLDGIRNILSLLDTASQLDPENGRYDLCRAIMVHDYYVTNGMRVPEPEPAALLESAASKALNGPEVVHLLGTLRIPEGPLRDGCVRLAGL